MVNKLYTPVNWKNYPSKDTPMTATNLNKMDSGIDDLDDRLVSVANSQETMESDIDDIEEDISTLNENLSQVSNRLKWTKFGETTDENTIDMPSNFNEIMSISYSTTRPDQIPTFTITKEYFDIVKQGSNEFARLSRGYYYSSSSYFQSEIIIFKNGKIMLNSLAFNGTSYRAGATTYWYYR